MKSANFSNFCLALAGLALLALAGCAAPTVAERNSSYSATTGEKMDQVANQPLSDFNLSNTDIPPLLEKVMAAPYAPPAQNNCPGMKKEIAELDRTLGPDVEPAVIDKNGNLITNGRAKELAWGTARGAAEGWIPFHGVVREISGAAHHEQIVQRAIAAGFVRRAFLKGLSQSLFCPA